MYTSQTKEYGIFLKVKKYILLRKEIGQFSKIDYFQVLITKIDHKEENDQNISFNR